MPPATSSAAKPAILIAGASRGLGRGLAAEFLRRDWTVIGTVRDNGRTTLHDLADEHPDRLSVETLDVDDPASVAGLQERLGGRTLDILFVNAGTAPHVQDVPVGLVSSDEFDRVMRTNVLGPMRVIEALAPLVPATGLIGAMSSGQGSIANNEQGRRDVYRASKAALNMAMRSFAAREGAARTGDRPRAMLLLAPGWIRTDLGGADAPYSLEESLPVLAEVILAKRQLPGLTYLDRFGATVPW